MKIELGKNYLITTDAFFIAPDSNRYRAVFGPVTAIETDEGVLGIKTNRGSTNWYLVVGRMLVAGCQVHYAIQTDEVDLTPAIREIEHDGTLIGAKEALTQIYDAS